MLAREAVAGSGLAPPIPLALRVVDSRVANGPALLPLRARFGRVAPDGRLVPAQVSAIVRFSVRGTHFVGRIRPPMLVVELVRRFRAPVLTQFTGNRNGLTALVFRVFVPQEPLVAGIVLFHVSRAGS